MAKQLTGQEILKILETGEFISLKGVVEDHCLECKGEPYPLRHTDKEKLSYYKQEFAKDVSSLANTPEGGLILIGAQTERIDTHVGDEIAELRPFPKTLIDPKQYQDILEEWIYPSVLGVEVKWFTSPDNSEQGLAAIVIPPQVSTRQPFLLTRTRTEDGKKTELVFGYIERRQAHSPPKTVHEIQALLRDGLHYQDRIEERFGTLEASIDRLLSSKIEEEEAVQDHKRREVLRTRLSVASGEAGLHEGPAYVLWASPITRTNLPTLFADEKDPVVKLLADPPELRRSGFDPHTGERPRIVRGMKRQATNKGYKVLELWPDATLIFCATGGSDFLAWGRYYKEGFPLRINQLVLIESTYLFLKLVQQIYQYATPSPSRIEFGLELRQMTVAGKNCILHPGPLTDFDFGIGAQTAPDSGNTFHFVWEATPLQPEIVAFQLVKQVYEWFEFPNTAIPYTSLFGDYWGIDPDQIRKIS